MKISVIMPTYNDCKSIEETLDSLKNQTYKNWELVIVDDGSIDDTKKVINRYIENNNLNKKIIKGTNGYCYKFKTSNCTGTVTFGAAGYVAKDKEMPVTLDIFAAEKDFTGVMKVTLPGENGKGIAYQSAVKCKS